VDFEAAQRDTAFTGRAPTCCAAEIQAQAIAWRLLEGAN
jgi:hypothetical protein